MKHNILAGSLTAHPDNNGNHFNNYISNKLQIIKIICEELILHDQILIPIQDYLTACGLIYILGESNFISLLESNKIKFLRSQHRITFCKSLHLNGDIGLSSPTKIHPWSGSDEYSVQCALQYLSGIINIKNKKLLTDLLVSRTDYIDINNYLKVIRKNTFNAFDQISIPNKNFNDFIGHTLSNKVTGTTWSNKPVNINNPIEVILGLAITNFETNLLKAYKCSSSSTTVNLNELIFSNIKNSDDRSRKLWSVTDLHKVPDLGKAVMENEENLSRIIKITNSTAAASFRDWFHSNSELDHAEIQREFACLVDREPWYKSNIGEISCSAAEIYTGILFGTVAGAAHTAINKLLGVVKEKSPKYFINQLRNNIKV